MIILKTSIGRVILDPLEVKETAVLAMLTPQQEWLKLDCKLNTSTNKIFLCSIILIVLFTIKDVKEDTHI